MGQIISKMLKENKYEREDEEELSWINNEASTRDIHEKTFQDMTLKCKMEIPSYE